MSSERDAAWATCATRAILGLMLLFAGWDKIVQVGILEFARGRFVVPVSGPLPDWLLGLMGAFVSLSELMLGALLLAGLWTSAALCATGAFLIVTMAGYGVSGLLWPDGPTAMSADVVNSYVMPRAGLLLLLLWLPRRVDAYTVDALLTHARSAAASLRWDAEAMARQRAWALLLARTLLGVLFFVAGINKVFLMGAVVHARTLFVDRYADTLLPVWGLWASGTSIPFIELASGALVLLGCWTRLALGAQGAILVLVTFGHLYLQPNYVFNSFVLTRTALMAFVLLLPEAADRYSIDQRLRRARHTLPAMQSEANIA